MWQQCHLEAKVRLQLLLALLRSRGNSELLPMGSGFLIQILEGMRKEKETGGGGGEGQNGPFLPLFKAVCCSCLLAVFG